MNIIWADMLMYVGHVVFTGIIAEVFLPGLIVKFEVLLRFAIKKPEDCISIAREHWRLMVLLTMPTVVVLSM